VLIGIDAYRAKPLGGCVNDVDAVQRLLIDRAGVPPENIRRLVSPGATAPGATAPGATAVPEVPATLENIRAALAELTAEVQAGDRVFFYYSGHGVRVPFAQDGGYTIHREALVPVDAEADAASPRLLYDHELNAQLARLAQRTRAVTCVLDCCHSAGVTRNPGLPGATSRSLDPARHLNWRAPRPGAGPAPTRGEDEAPAAGGYHVVSACLDFELAMETAADEGICHGLLTRAFTRAMDGIPDDELGAVPWSRIWQAMSAEVEARNPWQHLWTGDNLARAVLGGPAVDGDPGLPIRRAGDAYELGAGALASVTESALIAVYGDQPARFPPAGSVEDRASRCGLLRVTRASRDSARAVAEGAPFELPPGARGRLVEPGAPARLRCALVPPNERVAAELRASPFLEVVEASRAQVRLQEAAGQWLLVDDVHDETEDDALAVLRPDQLVCALEVLELYYQYALPLRMAAAAGDLPGALRLQVLLCDGEISPAAAQLARLPEAPTEGASAYHLRHGAPVCFRVHNTSTERLRVALLNSAASGRVQVLGDAVIDARSAYVFWAQSTLGKPFRMTVPPGRRQGIDRMVAIGTTAMGKDLGYLRVERRFADILNPMRSSFKDLGGAAPPRDRWTATQVIVKTRAMHDQRGPQ
jgi:hypothetical protein